MNTSLRQKDKGEQRAEDREGREGSRKSQEPSLRVGGDRWQVQGSNGFKHPRKAHLGVEGVTTGNAALKTERERDP